MKRSKDRCGEKTYMEPIKWCRLIAYGGYVTAALIVAAHVIWYFAARSILALPPDVYLRNYILLPAAGLSAMIIGAERLLRSPRIPLPIKEVLSLFLTIIISFYLSITHPIAKVLMGSFILPIFASTVFSNRKLTRLMYWISNFAVILIGILLYDSGKLNGDWIMQIFVACFMFLCAYLTARILILHGHEDLTALLAYDNRQRDMREQLKLDPFTGLYNKKTFDEQVSAWIEECQSANAILSLAIMDIDHFKDINDRYGHASGDRALLQLSQTLKNNQAENIRAFRVGGEEFAMLFRDCGTEEAYRICEAVRALTESSSLACIGNRNITFSCGLACTNRRQTNREAFVNAADSALYAAKNSGRNQVVIYQGDIG